jgi:hypothetical protein
LSKILIVMLFGNSPDGWAIKKCSPTPDLADAPGIDATALGKIARPPAQASA